MKRLVILAVIAVMLIVLIIWGILREGALSDSTSDEGSESSEDQSKQPAEEEILQSVHYYRRYDDNGSDVDEIQTKLIRTKQELSAIAAQRDDTWPERYYDAFFVNSDMLLIMIDERSGTNRHRVESLRLEDGKVVVSITRLTGYLSTDDVKYWDIVLQCAKNSLPDVEIEVQLKKRVVDNEEMMRLFPDLQ